MGIKWWVLYFELPNTRLIQFKAVADSQAMMDMQKKLELLQSENKFKSQGNAEKWTLHCSLHLPQTPSSQVQTELLIFTFDENPQKSYHVINANVLEADKLMISVMDKLRLYRLRQTIDVHVSSFVSLM